MHSGIISEYKKIMVIHIQYHHMKTKNLNTDETK